MDEKWWNAAPVVQGPKARADWGAGAVELPDGQVVRYGPRGGVTVLAKGNRGGADGDTPDLKEFEINAAARATLMDSGLRSYNQALREGYDPGSLRNVFARGIEDAPIPGGNFFADVLRDKPSERARAAELQFVDGALRTTSGANAPEPEQLRANRAYFRQPGESKSVEAERAALRSRFRDTAIRAAGKAYVPGLDGMGTEASPFVLREGQSRVSLPKGAIYRYERDQNLRRNDNGDAGNPIIRKAPTAAGSSRAGSPDAPIRVRSPEEAERLPPGTVFLTPDGRRKVR